MGTMIITVDGEMMVAVMFLWLQNVGVMKVSKGVLAVLKGEFLKSVQVDW